VSGNLVPAPRGCRWRTARNPRVESLYCAKIYCRRKGVFFKRTAFPMKIRNNTKSHARVSVITLKPLLLPPLPTHTSTNDTFLNPALARETEAFVSLSIFSVLQYDLSQHAWCYAGMWLVCLCALAFVHTLYRETCTFVICDENLRLRLRLRLSGYWTYIVPPVLTS